MESSVPVQIAVSLIVALFAAFLAVWGWRNEREEPGRRILPFAVALLLVVWTPHAWVDTISALLVGLVVASRFRFESRRPRDRIFLQLLVFIASAAFIWPFLLNRLVPGGTSTLLALLAAGLALPPALRAAPVLLRVRRAAQLKPGERPDHEVYVGGRLGSETVPPPPTLHVVETMGAWRIIWPGGRHASPDRLTIYTPKGPVVVDLERVEVMSSEAHCSKVESMEAFRVAKALGDEEMIAFAEQARSEGLIAPFELAWLPPGAGVYVVGRPFWRKMAGTGYRDAEVVPVFEGESGDEPALVDQSSEEHTRQLTWDVLRGAGWGLIAGLIALLEMLRQL